MNFGSEKMLEKRFDGPGKSWNFFVSKSVGTLMYDQMAGMNGCVLGVPNAGGNGSMLHHGAIIRLLHGFQHAWFHRT